MTYDYSKVPIGTKLFSLRFGEIEVLRKEPQSVICDTKFYGQCRWTLGGFFSSHDSFPDLYPSKPEIIAPPMPKFTRRVERYVVYDTMLRECHKRTFATAYEARSQFGIFSRWQIIPFTIEEEIP